MRIAIVGGGISGLVAGYYLQRDHDVKLFEADERIGGHTNTIDCHVAGRDYAIDTGFIVFNDRTYPNFIHLLDQLKVDSQATSMSFSVSCEATGLEYNGTNLNGLFAQRRNLFNPKFLLMLRDFSRFGTLANRLLDESEEADENVASFLQRNRFSDSFIRHYFLPMGAAIWSASLKTFEDFPIRFVAQFYRNHGLLEIRNRPQWRVIQGGSRQYIGPLTRSWSDQIFTRSPVERVQRDAGKVLVTIAGESPADFDHVIFACHSDQALRILGDDAFDAEREFLTAFPYQSNVAALHTQASVLPRNRRAWACWNYFCPAERAAAATVTYNMNMLQSIDSETTFCVTLNDNERVDPENILGEFHYEHPTFSVAQSDYQSRQHEFINHESISFCGAWLGNGFHEDGVKSALAVVEKLSAVEARIE